MLQAIERKGQNRFHVAELARRAGVTPATVRYYARVGLLDPGREAHNGYRCFSASDLQRLSLIRQAQALGLTIGDVKAVLETIETGASPRHQVRSLIAQRLAGIQRTIAKLLATQNRIERALSGSSADRPLDGALFCRLIEQLETIDDAPQVTKRNREFKQNRIPPSVRPANQTRSFAGVLTLQESAP